MDCVHNFIFAPHRVCSKCGLIDDDVRFYKGPHDLTKIGNKYNDGDHWKSLNHTYIADYILLPSFIIEGKTEIIDIGNRVIRVMPDWSAKRQLIATSRIRYICKNLGAEHLVKWAEEQCIKWLKDPWVTNPAEPHTALYQTIAYVAVWYAMRAHHYPMSFTRYLDIINEFGSIKNFRKKFLLIRKGLKLERPNMDIPSLTHTFCELFRYDITYQTRLRQITDQHVQFNAVLMNKATKIASKFKGRGSPRTISLIILTYTAITLEKYLIKKKLAHPLPVSDIMGFSPFQNLFGVERNHINRCIKARLPQLQRCFNVGV